MEVSLDVSPDGKTIAFDMLGNIFLMPSNGGKAERLMEGMSFDSHPKFSPDGKSLLFLSDRDGNDEVWLMNLATKKTSQLTKSTKENVQSADWSPDGNYIVVAQGRRNLKLHLYHKDGGSGIQLIKTPENLKTIEPAFSPDGRYIWFARRTGAWNYNAQLPQYQIATFDRETGDIQTKTSRYGSAFSPTPSPDGKYLVYGTRYNEQTGLILRNLETDEEKWLAYPVQRDEQESIAPLGVLPAMSFTPDSQHLLASYGGKIHKIAINGGSAQELAYEVDFELEMGPKLEFKYPISDDKKMTVTQIRDGVLSPNGKQLVFTALNKLYIMDYPNGKPKRLTTANVTEAQPSWSPDGTQIAYVTWSEVEGGAIYKLAINGKTAPVKLTNKKAIYQEPVWSPKGDRIVFAEGAAQAYREATGPGAFDDRQSINWISANGGESNFIAKASVGSNPHFSEGSDRIYLYSGSKGLISIRWDGTDEKAYVKVRGITIPMDRSQK